MPDYELYTKPEFLADITKRIGALQASDRVALATMSFDAAYPAVGELFETLAAAAQRGVNVSLAVDAYNFLKGKDQFFGPLFWQNEMPPASQLKGEFLTKQQQLDALTKAGVRVSITNQPRRRLSNPFGGRSHIKFAVINQRLYLGGCNLDNPNNLDLMAGWQDPGLADELYAFSESMHAAGGLAFMAGQDRQMNCSLGTIFIDAGKKRQSLILRQGLAVIGQAKASLLFASQFFPNRATASAIRAAYKRGTKVSIRFNHPANFTRNERLPQYLNIMYARLTMPAGFLSGQLPRSQTYLHAKIIATESAAMIGSHNYISTGVNFGTAEIALLSHETSFVQDVVRKCDELLAST